MWSNTIINFVSGFKWNWMRWTLLYVKSKHTNTHTFFVNNFLINNDHRLKLFKDCKDLDNTCQGQGIGSLNCNNYFHFYSYTIYFNIFGI